MAKALDNRKEIDAQAVKIFGFDATSYLSDSTPPFGTIVDSSWSLPDGVVSDQDEYTDTQTTIKLSIPSGEVGEIYRLVNHFTTSTGEQDDATLILRIVEN